MMYMSQQAPASWVDSMAEGGWPSSDQLDMAAMAPGPRIMSAEKSMRLAALGDCSTMLRGPAENPRCPLSAVIIQYSPGFPVCNVNQISCQHLLGTLSPRQTNEENNLVALTIREEEPAALALS